MEATAANASQHEFLNYTRSLDHVGIDDDDDADDDLKHWEALMRIHERREDELIDIIVRDDTQRFVSFIKREIDDYGVQDMVWNVPSMVRVICEYRAVGCAASLMNGETSLVVDLNTPDQKGCCPLHHAAGYDTPDALIIEFLISKGARTDIRHQGEINAWRGKLPLEICLDSGRFENVRRWNDDSNEYEPTRRSIFMLVALLCLPRMEEPLAKVRVLASRTKETEEIFLHYVRSGELANVAILLAGAHKKLASKDVLSDADKNTDIRQLLDVFERLGDAIDAYRKQERELFQGAFEETVDFALNLLKGAGFVLDREDVDLTIYEWVKFSMDWDRCYGECYMTRKKLKHPKERPSFLKPGETLRAASNSNQKMGEKGDAGAEPSNPE